MRKRNRRRLTTLVLFLAGIWIGHNLGDISEIIQDTYWSIAPCKNVCIYCGYCESLW